MRHNGTQNIETKRLILKKIVLKNAQDLYELCSDKDVIKWLEIPIYTSVDMAIDYIGGKLTEKYKRADFYDWGVFLKESDKLIGRVSVYQQDENRRMADLVWFTNGKYAGKGYATEAAKAVIDY